MAVSFIDGKVSSTQFVYCDWFEVFGVLTHPNPGFGFRLNLKYGFISCFDMEEEKELNKQQVRDTKIRPSPEAL